MFSCKNNLTTSSAKINNSKLFSLFMTNKTGLVKLGKYTDNY